jgi:hypothetical protein
LADWEARVTEKKGNTTVVYADIILERITWLWENYQNILFQSLLDNLATLLTLYPDIESLCGMAIYHYSKENKETPRFIRTLYNKVTSLLDQHRSIRGINDPEMITRDNARGWIYCIQSAAKNVVTNIIDSSHLLISINEPMNTRSYVQLFDNRFEDEPSLKYKSLATLTGRIFSFSCDIKANVEGNVTIFFMEYNNGERVSNRSDVFFVSSELRRVSFSFIITDSARYFKLAFLLQIKSEASVILSGIEIMQEDG